MRGRGVLLGVVLLGVIGDIQGGQAAEVHAVAGMAHDSNLFEAQVDPQGGWVNRLYVFASGYLLRRSRGYVSVQHQGGIKRFWQAERQADGRAGDVVVNRLEVAGQIRVAKRVVLSNSSVLKVKQVSRVPGEEGYLRGSVEGRAVARLSKGASGTLYYRRGGDDSRDALLPEVSLHEVGIEGCYGRSRQLRGRVGVTWRWLDYDRPALEWDPGGGVVPLGFGQSDLVRGGSAGVQVYWGMLVHLTYGFLDNRSNSFGYGFSAHRVQALVIRHLVGGVDGQAYVNVQFRRYDDSLIPLPGGGSEVDEYEQTMGVLKLSRQVTDRFGISLQYGFFRNGARQSGGFYRKHVYTLSMDTSL